MRGIIMKKLIALATLALAARRRRHHADHSIAASLCCPGA
jgi:hypothetical protein